MKTIKLYDENSRAFSFQATVSECKICENGFAVILDKTAFFPEGGGQPSDTGTLGGANVTDVQINDGIITHFTDAPLEPGAAVSGKLDSAKRFRRMQNHSGEHILSGLAHTLFGCTNVGFHLGDEEVTVDFDKELTNSELLRLERLANEAVWANAAVTAEYPDPEKLKSLEYRSKLELTEDVRIVTVGGYDVCACCAPHVSRTGEIGIIKIISSIRHRGGVRLKILCGSDALNDYNIKCENLSEIAVTLCTKQNETAKTFKKFYSENNELKAKISSLSRELTRYKAENLSPAEGNIILFEQENDMAALRSLALKGAAAAGGFCAVFGGSDKDGYSYAVSSKSVDLRQKAKEINQALCGKGGGSSELIQGSVKSDRAAIEKIMESL